MIIYEAFNKQNGKVYIGLTINSLEHRMKSHLRSAKAGSNMYFHKAIRKYGKDSFEWHTVLEVDKLEELYEKEKLVISLYEDWQTYNVSLGGEHSAYGMTHSDEVKKYCGECAKLMWNNKRAKDIYPEFVFNLSSYKEAKEYGIPKTTWYRHRNKQLEGWQSGLMH